MGSSRGVIVVTGAGGMGSAIARRIGAGSTVVLADFNELLLEVETRSLVAIGYDVVSHVVDVSQKVDVDALATDAATRGPVTAVVHTAGLSPVQAPVDAIMRVDLLGTAHMLDAFGAVISPGGAGVFIASMAGTMAPPNPELDLRLATTSTSKLLELPELAPEAIADPASAYVVAKRANQVRVKAASLVWGRRGARVNTISPGIISTAMGTSELEGPSGEIMRAMIANSGTARVGTPEDIAAVVDFLLSRDAGYITGTDVLVDGGVFASLQAPPSGTTGS
jgi:NAD(P)-dependent dehydrogenase (short-subunit alcohol dehydrogenase family)